MVCIIISYMSIVLADSIDKQELKALLQTFWGEDNQVAVYSQTIYPFQEVENFFRSDLNKNLTKKNILAKFTNSLISFGFKEDNKLVAHTGLLVQPWGEIETTASIVEEKYRGQGLMAKLNFYKHQLIGHLLEKGFEVTTYGLIGSKSIYHAETLFTFPELHYGPKFINIGPFLYKRKLASVARKDNDFLIKYSLINRNTIYSNSVQIGCLNLIKPPRIEAKVVKVMPESVNRCLKHFGYISSHTVKFKDVLEKHTSPAEIDIWHISGWEFDEIGLIKELKRSIKAGKSIIIRLPLLNKNINSISKIKNLSASIPSQRLIFMGLTILNNTWCVCFSFINTDYYDQFMKRMMQISLEVNNPLNYLCQVIYLDAEGGKNE